MKSYAYEPGRLSPRTSASTTRINAVSTARVPILLRLAFLLFVFAIPIESLNVSFDLGSVSLARFAGLGLFGLSFIYFKKCYSAVPPAIWGFFGYLSIFAITGWFIAPAYTYFYNAQLYTVIQLIVFFWLASNILQDIRLARSALLTYAASAVFLSVAVLLGLPGFAQTVATRQGDRFTAAFLNPNLLGLVLAVGGMILVGFALENKIRKMLFLIPTMILLLMIVETGSRASVVAFVAGMFCFLSPFGSGRRKILAYVLVGFALLGLGYLILNNETFMSRVELTSEGNSAGRDKIVIVALDMIAERPLLGWRPVEYQYQMMGRYSGIGNYPQDPHNMPLNMLVEVGLVGALPFFTGIALCGLAAWKGRNKGLGLLPFALLVTLMVGLQFHSFFTSKAMWLVLAACAAANRSRGSQLSRSTSDRQTYRPFGRRLPLNGARKSLFPGTRRWSRLPQSNISNLG